MGSASELKGCEVQLKTARGTAKSAALNELCSRLCDVRAVQTFIQQHRYGLPILVHPLYPPYTRLCPASERPVVQYTEGVGGVGRSESEDGASLRLASVAEVVSDVAER